MVKIDARKFDRRQKVALVGILVVLVIITAIIMWQTRTDNSVAQFRLPESMYQEEGVKEISAEYYADLIERRKSFLVLAHNTSCPAGMPLTSVVRDLTHEYGMTVYGLMQDAFKQSLLADEIQFLPSLAVVREGRVIAYLRADSDEDMPAYKSLSGLKTWLEQYIKL